MLLVVYSRPLRNETQTVDAAKTNRGQLIHLDQIYRVGYNQVRPPEQSILYSEVGGEPDFYFTHSYRMKAGSDIGQSECLYGENFVASFEVNNIYGTQFHPELSQKNGIRLIKNFLENS